MSQDLEEIIEHIRTNNEFLTICKNKKLTTLLPLKQRDVTIKYLQMVMSTINENGTLLKRSKLGIKNPGDFLDSYSDIFGINKNKIIDILNDQHSFVNRWVYRSFMEFWRESLALSSQEFYPEIAKRSILNSKYEIISVSKFFDLGTVLKHMGKQTNSNWTELTTVNSTEPWFDRGTVTISRSTNEEHLEELGRYFPAEIFKELLKQDCILTESAYKNLFTLFGDHEAKLHDHESCEVKGDQSCDYMINYTPVPIFKLLWRSILYKIPTVRKMAKENEELKTQIFSLEEIISKKTERIESLIDRLKTIQKISMAGTKHSTINRVRRLYLGIENNLIEDMSEYFSLLHDYSKQDKTKDNFIQEISKEFGIHSLINSNNNYSINTEELRREVEGIIDPNKKPMKINQGMNDFLSAFSNAFSEPKNEGNNEQRINELISTYETIKTKYFEKKQECYNNLEKQIISKNPFEGLKILLQAENLADEIIDSFEKNKREIEQIEDVVSVKESILYSIEEAKRNREKEIHFEYDSKLNNDYLRTNRDLFEIVIRDLVGNSIDANSTNIKFNLEDIAEDSRYNLCLTIVDDGNGMNMAKIEQLNIFLSNDASEHNISTKQYGGEGTKILKDFIRLQNARAEYSLNENKGTMLKLYMR